MKVQRSATPQPFATCVTPARNVFIFALSARTNSPKGPKRPPFAALFVPGSPCPRANSRSAATFFLYFLNPSETRKRRPSTRFVIEIRHPFHAGGATFATLCCKNVMLGRQSISTSSAILDTAVTSRARTPLMAGKIRPSPPLPPPAAARARRRRLPMPSC